MGQASSSSASTSGIQSSGGNITNNPPNYGLYIVLGLGFLLVLFWIRKKGARS
jgi:hypothetical protein